MGVLLDALSRDFRVSFLFRFLQFKFRQVEVLTMIDRLSLEEVYFVFEEGFGIKKSQQLRKQKLVEAAKLKAIFE